MRRICSVAIVTAALTATVSASAVNKPVEFKINKSVMSEEYWKIWNDEVQAKIDADIEKYRKADAVVEIDAPDGANVSVDQVTHDFFFGAHIFNFGQLGKRNGTTSIKIYTGHYSIPRQSLFIGGR